jgi:hypothetical protein
MPRMSIPIDKTLDMVSADVLDGTAQKIVNAVRKGA